MGVVLGSINRGTGVSEITGDPGRAANEQKLLVPHPCLSPPRRHFLPPVGSRVSGLATFSSTWGKPGVDIQGSPSTDKGQESWKNTPASCPLQGRL